MKIFTRLLFLIVALCCWSIVGYGQTEIFNLAGGGAFPAGWSAINNGGNDVDRGSYYLVEPGTTGNKDIIESAVYDLSTYTSATFDVDVATFGSGTAHPLKVEISIDGGTSYTQTEVTTTPSSSSYIDGGTITLTAISNQVKLRLTNNGTSGRGVRMQNLILEASGVASSNDLTTEVFDSPPTQPAADDIESLDDTAVEAVDVFAFTIEDQGSGDGLPTQVTNISIKPHTSNTADWTDHIQGVLLNGGAITTGSPIITDTEINIPITAGDLDITDGMSTTVTLSVYLNTSNISDGAIFSCFIDADDNGFTADASGSGFADEFLLGDIVSNDFDIIVDASEFSFQQQPADGTIGNTLTPAVEVVAQDANGNIDLDYDLDIPLSTTGSFDGEAVTTVAAVNGVATFDLLIFDAAGTGLTLTALPDEDGVFVTESTTSTTFDIMEPVSIIISRVADPGDDANARFVELKNVGSSTQDISGWDINRYPNGATSPSGNVIDPGTTLEPGETYVIATNTNNFINAFGCNPGESNSNITGNGDDAYALLNNDDELVDIYGEIGVDDDPTWNYENSIAIRNAAVTAASTVWIASQWSIAAADVADIDVCPVVTPPDNDECVNATEITCGDNLANQTTVDATDNGDATGCAYGRGVWYSFEGNNQEVTVTADGSDDNFDLELGVSTSSDCINFVNIDCEDTSGGAGTESITFFANSGTTYYFYVAHYIGNSNTQGEFDISVTCTDVDIASGTDGICDAVDNITSTGSGAWLNIVDGSGDLVASVLDSENMGLLQTSIYINAGDVRQDGNNLPYLDRNISIEPATQPSGTVKVRWYLTTAEFDALAAADSDVSSISDLNITKFDGGCSDEFNGAGTVVQQSASGSLNAGYFVEVDVTSFSNFFLHADLVALPVEITSFTAKALNNQTHLSFTTATEENNSHFLIQRSTDEGKAFETIGQVDGKGDSNSTVDYKFVDTKPTAGMNYYRLQQFDFDGTNEFFGPVAVRFGGEVADAPVIWPVPARDRLQIQLPASDSDWQLEVFDLNGRRLLQKTTEGKGINTFFDLNSLPAGSYFLRWSNGSRSGQERFLKV